jgi:type IV secretion system protein VirB5
MVPDGLVPASHLRAAAASQPAPGADGASGMGAKHKRGQTMREGASMPPTRCPAATATAAVLRSILVKRSNPVMFTRPSTRYGVTPEAVTPYQRAAQIWDDRIGSARVQARNWRLACFGSLGLAGLLATGLIWQSAHGSIVPWVVEVDRLARAVSPAESGYTPSDPQIAFHLARFIENVRSVPSDPVVLRQDWLRAYDFATDKGALALNDYARTNDPFALIGKAQVAVDVEHRARLARQLPHRLERTALSGRSTGRDSTLVCDPEHYASATAHARGRAAQSARRLRHCPQLVEGTQPMRLFRFAPACLILALSMISALTAHAQDLPSAPWVVSAPTVPAAAARRRRWCRALL